MITYIIYDNVYWVTMYIITTLYSEKMQGTLNVGSDT